VVPGKPKPLVTRLWFRIGLAMLFVFVPSYSALGHTRVEVVDVVASVLAHPLAYAIPIALPIAKVLLMLALVAPCFAKRLVGAKRLPILYYASVLFVVAIFQNMGVTSRFGFAWLIGNTMIMLVVAGACLHDFARRRTEIDVSSLRRSRIWLVVPMLLAFFMPYTTDASGHVLFSLSTILTNEAGLTYCMITPVVIGVMLIFPGSVYKPTLSLVSFVALMLALTNVIVWFVLQPENWWMGVLHVPLFATSIDGFYSSRYTMPRPFR